MIEEFGLKSIIGFGNTTVEKALKNKPMKMCADLGSKMVVLSEWFKVLIMFFMFKLK